MIPNFDKEFQQIQRLFDDLPTQAGGIGMGFIYENFDQEAFQQKSGSGKWASRKNDAEAGKKRKERRALLVKSGDMRRSIDFDTAPGQVGFFSDLEHFNFQYQQVRLKLSVNLLPQYISPPFNTNKCD